MGFNEAFEPFTSNIYKRKTMAGEFILVNKYLVADLMKLGLWTKDLRNKIIVNEGSVQKIKEIPEQIREIYKTVWEIKQKNIIDLAADRGVYVCQSQSMNLFMEDPDFKKLSSMHFYAWQQGLKTGMYYLRTKPRAKVQQFTIEPEKNNNNRGNLKCTDEICTTCSS
jgi:ribonucleotide reductase alpha subunit